MGSSRQSENTRYSKIHDQTRSGSATGVVLPRHCVSVTSSAQEKPLSAQKRLFSAATVRAVPHGGWAPAVGGAVRAGEGGGLQVPPQGLRTVTGGSGCEHGPGWGSLASPRLGWSESGRQRPLLQEGPFSIRRGARRLAERSARPTSRHGCCCCGS